MTFLRNSSSPRTELRTLYLPSPGTSKVMYPVSLLLPSQPLPVNMLMASFSPMRFTASS